jgi:hypothetical protein
MAMDAYIYRAAQALLQPCTGLCEVLHQPLDRLAFAQAEWQVGCCGLLRLRTVGLQLCGPQTQRAERAACSFSDRLGAALMLAPLAATVRLAVERVAFSSLGAALVLAAPAAAVRDTVLGVASSGLGAAHLLAPLAAAVRDTAARIASR